MPSPPLVAMLVSVDAVPPAVAIVPAFAANGLTIDNIAGPSDLLFFPDINGPGITIKSGTTFEHLPPDSRARYSAGQAAGFLQTVLGAQTVPIVLTGVA